MKWLRTEIWTGSGVSPLFFIGLALILAALMLGGCEPAPRTIYVLYADQPARHVIQAYYEQSVCSDNREYLAFHHPTITFHCDREVHG